MKVVLFDIDGTLLSTGGSGQSAMEAALLAGFPVTELLCDIPTAGRTDRAIIMDLFRDHGIAFTEENWQRFQQLYLERLPGCIAGGPPDLLPGMRDIVEALAVRSDVMLGLLTGNFERGAKVKLSHFGIDHHFAFGGYGDHDVSRDDVARRALAEAARRLERDPDVSSVWVIGDTPADIQCSRAIGARAVAVATGIYPLEVLRAAEPDHLFESFADPQTLLSLLAAT